MGLHATQKLKERKRADCELLFISLIDSAVGSYTSECDLTSSSSYVSLFTFYCTDIKLLQPVMYYRLI